MIKGSTVQRDVTIGSTRCWDIDGAQGMAEEQQPLWGELGNKGAIGVPSNLPKAKHKGCQKYQSHLFNKKISRSHRY